VAGRGGHERCLPSAENTELAGFCNEFDAIEGSQFAESGEASVTCSPGGMFFHTTWNQWDFDQDGVTRSAPTPGTAASCSWMTTPSSRLQAVVAATDWRLAE
jgi:hypothetical protein